LHPDDSISVFLDLTDRVGSVGGEQGLLGLAFHPDHGTNGHFYVNYTDTLGDTHIARFTRDLINPDLGDAGTEMTMITMDQPALNHNGGDLRFGPDGYLYIFMGDGGGSGHNRSQELNGFFGKILRLDVDGGSPYAIPADNPFVGVPGADEIFAMGLRNPWRNSFDRLTGDLYIADVGGDSWEEIDVIKNDTSEFMNFGWKCYEGNMLRAGTLCDTIVFDFDFPVFEYPHSIDSGGFAVTGGFVYRGTEFPGLYGKYIFCDYISGNFWTMETDGTFPTTLHGYILDRITSFGEDVSGELYACVIETGNIYRMEDACSYVEISAVITEAASPVVPNGAIDLTISGAELPLTFIWSNGDVTEDITGLLPGNYTVTVLAANGCTANAIFTVEAACGPATGISTVPGTISAFIDWDDMGAAGYRFLYKPVGPGGWTQINTPVSQINLSGLNPSTAYQFRIRHKCPGSPGVFTATGNFITNPLRVMDPQVWVYPNPCGDILYVYGLPDGTPATLFNVQGSAVLETRVYTDDPLDLSALAPGIYILKAENHTEKIIHQE